MRTEQLIAELATRASRVEPLRPPAVRFLAWAAVAIASAALGFAVFGPRRGLAIVITQPWFVASAALVIGTAAIAAMASLVLAVPGAERSPAMRVSAFTLLAVWFALGATAVIRAGHGLSDASDWYVCFPRVIAIGLIPAWLLFLMLRRALPLRRVSAGALGALGAISVGSATIQFVCPLDVASHTFIGHFGPAATLCAIGAWLAPRLLKPAART